MDVCPASMKSIIEGTQSLLRKAPVPEGSLRGHLVTLRHRRHACRANRSIPVDPYQTLHGLISITRTTLHWYIHNQHQHHHALPLLLLRMHIRKRRRCLDDLLPRPRRSAPVQPRYTRRHLPRRLRLRLLPSTSYSICHQLPSAPFP
jgi:hypothetical protein